MPTTKDYVFVGGSVEYFVFPGDSPLASHGDFYFRNDASEELTLVLEGAWFAENQERKPLESFHIYEDDKPRNGPIIVPPGGELRFRITFPFVKVTVNPRVKFAVGVTGTCNGTPIQAVSELTFSLESPKRR